VNDISRREALERLHEAVERGTDQDLDQWAATGQVGLRLLRDVLTRRERPRWANVHPRDAIDNMATAVAAIAEAHPGSFLEVFADPALDVHNFVLTGLGRIDDPVATKRLAHASKSSDQWARMDAAIGLGRRRSAVAVAAFIELIADPDYLVRYHALKGLAAVGDRSALPPLRGFAAPTAFERELADNAIASIESRDEPRDLTLP
jgi:HEAT repeat protein